MSGPVPLAAQSGEEGEQSLPEFIKQLEVLFVPDAAAHSVNNQAKGHSKKSGGES